VELSLVQIFLLIAISQILCNRSGLVARWGGRGLWHVVGDGGHLDFLPGKM